MTRRAHQVVTAVALAVLAGCGGGSDSTASTTTSTEPVPVIETPAETTVVDDGTFSVLAGESTTIDLDALAVSIEARLSAAGHTAVSAEVVGDRVQVDAGDGPLGQSALEALLTEPGRLEIRPVREEAGPRHCTEAGPQGVGEDSVYPEHNNAGEISACYTIAPGGVTNDAIEGATANVNSDDEWAVDLVLTFEGIDTFNELAADCKHRRPPCDSGLAAIALDRVVLTAPRVRDSNFERHSIQISGDLDESSANALAADLTAEPLPRGLEIAD